MGRTLDRLNPLIIKNVALLIISKIKMISGHKLVKSVSPILQFEAMAENLEKLFEKLYMSI